MRTPDRIAAWIAALSFALGVLPAAAFDGPRSPVMDTAAPAVVAPARPAPGLGGAAELNPPRPPGTIPRGASTVSAPAVAPAARATPVPNVPLNAPVERSLGAPTAPAFAAPSAPITPFEAFRSGQQALRAGERAKAVTALEYAADQGLLVAQWKLARMYAEGEGVEQSDLRAFEYYSRIADMHADDSPGTQQARFVALAFVALGHYYREGIPDSTVRPDLPRARHMYSYAASYFGDAEAQYYLARMYLDGSGVQKDPRQAARWLNAAANKGQYQAQALLGRMLFKGEAGVPRQPARGLMWIALARANATLSETWIAELYESAFKQANEDERAQAGDYLVRWMNGRRD
jgi:uncharacterized protein